MLFLPCVHPKLVTSADETGMQSGAMMMCQVHQTIGSIRGDIESKQRYIFSCQGLEANHRTLIALATLYLSLARTSRVLLVALLRLMLMDTLFFGVFF